MPQTEQEREMFTCPNCGHEVDIDNTCEVDIGNGQTQRYCDDCVTNCDCCGETFLNEDTVHTADDDYVCNRCIEQHYFDCDECHEYIHTDERNTLIIRENGEEDRELDVCDNCLNNEYPEAEWDEDEDAYVLYLDSHHPNFTQNQNWQTGAVMDNNRIYQEFLDAEKSRQRCPLCMHSCNPCPSCLEKQAKQAKKEETTLWVYDTGHCQYHAPEHNRFKGLFYRMKHEHPYLYYGIELEVVFRDNANKAKTVREFIKATNGLFVSEYDRSVDNIGNGAEFISRPTSYKQWTSPETRKLLEEGIKVLKEAGAKVNQPAGCGLHVHLSRTFFEHNTTKDVKEIKSDMDWFFQVYQGEIEQISDRPYTQYCMSKAERIKQITPTLTRDMGLNVTLELEKGDLPASYENRENHHYAVVLTERTIEMRTFKSTLDIDKLYAYLQFCRALSHAARNMKITKETTFNDIISCKEGDELTKLVQKLKLDTSKKMKNKIEVK